MVSCSMNTIKYVLYAFNFIFTISGLGFIITGALVLSNLVEFRHFLEGKPILASIVLIIVGTIIFVIAFVGCYGTIKERYNLLVAFAIALLAIFIVELTTGVVVMVYKGDFDTQMKESLQESIKKYSSSKIDKDAWDTVQSKFGCCGIDASTDWLANDPVNFAMGLPSSCCVDQAATTCANSVTEANQGGCFMKLETKVRNNAKILIAVITGVIFIEVAGMILAGFLAFMLRREK